MTGEFTAWCNDYYKLKTQLTAQDQHFNNLLHNAPLYTGQNNLHELDAIISCNREVQAAKATLDKTFKEVAEARRTVLAIMEYFKMPPHTLLTGKIPSELEYEIWANESDALFVRKIRDLKPEPKSSCRVVITHVYPGDEGSIVNQHPAEIINPPVQTSRLNPKRRSASRLH